MSYGIETFNAAGEKVFSTDWFVAMVLDRVLVTTTEVVRSYSNLVGAEIDYFVTAAVNATGVGMFSYRPPSIAVTYPGGVPTLTATPQEYGSPTHVMVVLK